MNGSGYPWKQLGSFGKNYLNKFGMPLTDGGEVRWYADSSVASSGTGSQWSTAFKTITEAVAAASAGDYICLRGEFDEGAAVTIDKELKIYGENESSNGYPTMIYNSGDHQLFIVKGNNVVIDSIGFVQTQANIAIQIGDTAGQAYYKLFINKCKFDLYGTGTWAIASGDTADAPDIHIHDCLFRSCATGCIQSNWTRARVDDCIILVDANGKGISHVPTGGSRPDSVYARNRIIGADSGDTGFCIENAPSAGALIVYDNYVMNCATTITQHANSSAFCNNYIGGDGGGAVFDPIA